MFSMMMPVCERGHGSSTTAPRGALNTPLTSSLSGAGFACLFAHLFSALHSSARRNHATRFSMFSSSSQKKLKITCVVFPFNTNVLGQCSAVQESESIPRPFLQRIEYQPLANHQALSRKNRFSNLVDIKVKESKN
jgi:hypothetical protein